MKKFLYHASRKTFLTLFRGFWEFEAWGTENVPRSGAAILAANHVSFLDPPALGAVLSRHVSFVARGTLADAKALAVFLWYCEVIQIRRGEPDSQAIRSILRALKEGKLAGLFPEGTRSVDGRLGPFEEGTVLIARRAGVPVIPVGIEGTHSILPKGALFPRRGRIRVVYGKAFDASAGTREEANQELRRRIGLLLEEARSKVVV